MKFPTGRIRGAEEAEAAGGGGGCGITWTSWPPRIPPLSRRSTSPGGGATGTMAAAEGRGRGIWKGAPGGRMVVTTTFTGGRYSLDLNLQPAADIHWISLANESG